jgi:hypothetical protein
MTDLQTLVIAGLAVLAGCQTMSTENDVPARIVNPSAASRAALQSAVNDALRTEVLLAADALTGSSILVVEINPQTSMRSQAATGRIMEPPLRFNLVLHNSDCILVDQRDQSRHLLEDTQCVAE